MKTKRLLPHGYRTEFGQIRPGSGWGDEIYGTVLLCWETRQRGMLWWRRSITGWFEIGGFEHESDAIKWAQATAEMTS